MPIPFISAMLAAHNVGALLNGLLCIRLCLFCYLNYLDVEFELVVFPFISLLINLLFLKALKNGRLITTSLITGHWHHPSFGQLHKWDIARLNQPLAVVR